MKRQLIIILTILLFVSCAHEYENTAEQRRLFEERKDQKFDTLITVFILNTGSLDLYLIQGQLTLPTDIKSQLSDTLTRDIKVCGNFPKDLIDMTSNNYDADLAFKIVGKTILADTNSGVGKVPLFYVSEWTKFYYDYNSWMEKGDLGVFLNRKKMLEDVVKYLKLEGESVTQIKNLLGQPDYVELNKIAYKIDEQFGSNIDPIETTTLSLKFDKDSIIREKKIEKIKNRR